MEVECYTQNQQKLKSKNEFFNDRGLYHIETNPLIYRVYQWTGFYMIGIFVMKEFICKIAKSANKRITSKAFYGLWF